MISNSGDIDQFYVYPHPENHVNGCHGSRAFFHSALEFIFGDKSFFFITVVPINDLAPMKNWLGDAK